MKKRRFADGGDTSKPPKKDYSDRGFGGAGDDRYGGGNRTKPQSLPEDTPNPGYDPQAVARANGPGLGLGKRRDYMINKAVDDATNGVETPQGNGMKKGGSAKGKSGSGGGLGALAALQGAMAGAGGGAPGGAPMGPPPGAGGPPPGPPGGGMPPGMKKGGHVHKMNAGGKPHEDEPLRQAKRKAKELDKGDKDQKDDKADKEGDFKYAKGGKVNPFAKGKALDKADGKNEKEEKSSEKGAFKYAKGGHVSGFRASAHGIESKGKTRGRCI